MRNQVVARASPPCIRHRRDADATANVRGRTALRFRRAPRTLHRRDTDATKPVGTASNRDCRGDHSFLRAFWLILLLVPIAFTAHASSASSPQRVQLANGAQIIVEQVPSAPLVAIEVWIRAGVADETPETSGAAHLLEHLIFKGAAEPSTDALDEAFECAGGILDAFTERDWTRYRASVLPNRWQIPLKTLLQRLLRPALPEAELEKERKIILNDEYALHFADPVRPARYALFAKAFESQPYALPLLGDVETLKRLDITAVQAFHRAHYRPERMTIVLVGAVEPTEARRIVEEALTQQNAPAEKSSPALLGRTTSLQQAPIAIPSNATDRLSSEPRTVEASAGVCLALGLRTPPADDVNGWLCAEIVRTALAEPYRGLLYEGEGALPFGRLHSEYLPRVRGSLIAVYALPPVEPMDDWQVRTSARWDEALQKIANGDARDALEQARALVLARHEASMRNPLERARWYGLCATLTTPLSTQEFALRLRQLPIEQVEQVARAILSVPRWDTTATTTRWDTTVQLMHGDTCWDTTVQATRRDTRWDTTVQATRQRLANGLRVIVLPTTESAGVLIQVAIAHPQGQFSAAIGELTARMLFGATQNETERTLAARIARSGGSLRIEWTPAGAQITAYARRDSVVNVLSLLQEALLRAEFTTELLQRAVRQALYDRAYHEGAQSWRLSARLLNLYATEAELERASLSEIRAYYRACYRPGNIVIVMAGDMRSETLAEWARQFFGEDWRLLPTPTLEPQALSASPQTDALTDARGVAYTGYAWATPVPTAADYYALQAWQLIVGEGKSSRLFIAAREAQGVGYELRVENYLLKNAVAGVGWIQTGKTPAPKSLFLNALNAPVEPTELERVRALLHGEWERLRLNLNAFTAALAWAELSGLGYETVLNAPVHIDALNREAIQAVCAPLLHRSSVQLK
ncbi:MAG: hypothetical protein KatS3mg019_0802 [Fimbriimonadales bacterium]|nr:MAG: hypothetical protein KatS3mg019_0802 [Fimbriimonadales bacterium]